MRRTNKKGFTIVELVIVIAVIAILAAVLIPNISRLVKKANESADIQAVRNMNTFLAAEKVTDGVDSILDVYDLFKDSGYNVDSYSPLYSGRHFYYDKQYNQILYVENSTGKVLFPEEHKNELQNDHDWLSLSMEAPTPVKPNDYNDETANTISATVSTPAEYAFMVEEYNKGKVQNLTLTLANDIDMKGANCVIKIANGNITIKSKDSSKPVVIKNVTANAEVEQETIRNAAGIKADYYGGGLVSKINKGTVSVQNVIFENINVKVPTAGQVGVLVGCVQGSGAIFELDNVTIRNCSVIGHRDVGAIAGAAQNGGTIVLKNNITIENTNVKTTGGRAALLVGKIGYDSQHDTALKTESLQLSVTGSALSIYEDGELKQKFVTALGDLKSVSTVEIEGQTQYVYSLKDTSGKENYSAYGYRADALVIVEKSSGAWTVVTDLTEAAKGVVNQK